VDAQEKGVPESPALFLESHVELRESIRERGVNAKPGRIGVRGEIATSGGRIPRTPGGVVGATYPLIGGGLGAIPPPCNIRLSSGCAW